LREKSFAETREASQRSFPSSLLLCILFLHTGHYSTHCVHIRARKKNNSFMPTTL
jgi:hypothetical protein